LDAINTFGSSLLVELGLLVAAANLYRVGKLRKNVVRKVGKMPDIAKLRMMVN
jgi:hypothetical protein